MATRIVFLKKPAQGDTISFTRNGIPYVYTYTNESTLPPNTLSISSGSLGSQASLTGYELEVFTDFIEAFSYEDVNDPNSPGEMVITGKSSGFIFSPPNISNFQFSSNFAYIPSSGLQIMPNNISFSHIINNALPSVDIYIEGGNWKLIGNSKFSLSSTTKNLVKENFSDALGNYQVISGSAAAIIKITLGSFFNGSNVSPADCVGAFVIQVDNINTGTLSYGVMIHKLDDFFSIPYGINELAFTLDNKNIEIATDNVDTYFQLDTVIKWYDFFTNVERIQTVNQKIVLFNNSQKTNIGRLIHRLMANFESPNSNTFQYRYATATISCAEKRFSDNGVVRSGTSSNIKFVAGLSRGITNIGFLEFNPKMNRVTTNGFAYLNMVLPSGQFELKTYKNGKLVNTKTLLEAQDKTMCEKVYFNTFNQGDLIEYKIVPLGGAPSAAKSFMVFPESFHSNILVWENEFLLQSALECTGTANIKSDIEFQSQKVYQNFVEKLNYLSSTKEVKLSINTGWLMQTDVDTIESLMRSKRVWLTKGNEAIALRPISKSIVNQDLERELIDFTIEFIINRNYDEETYTL